MEQRLRVDHRLRQVHLHVRRLDRGLELSVRLRLLLCREQLLLLQRGGQLVHGERGGVRSADLLLLLLAHGEYGGHLLLHGLLLLLLLTHGGDGQRLLQLLLLHGRLECDGVLHLLLLAHDGRDQRLLRRRAARCRSVAMDTLDPTHWASACRTAASVPTST